MLAPGTCRPHTEGMSGPPGPDGRHDDLGEAELEGLALLVPDDPRSLDQDRLDYLDELRERAGAARPPAPFLRRFVAPRWLDRFGVPGPLLLVLVLTVGLVAGIFAAAVGSPALAPTPVVPLAGTGAGPVGSIGGLTPDIVLSNPIADAPLRSLRPLMLVLIQGDCADCTTILHSIALQAQEYRLDLVIAGPPSQTARLEQIERDALGASAAVMVDPGDVLGRTYLPSGVTTVLVHSDGIVGDVLHDVTATQRLETALAQLSRPGIPA